LTNVCLPTFKHEAIRHLCWRDVWFFIDGVVQLSIIMLTNGKRAVSQCEKSLDVIVNGVVDGLYAGKCAVTRANVVVEHLRSCAVASQAYAVSCCPSQSDRKLAGRNTDQKGPVAFGA
jgi:hypothetical protein